MRDVHEYVTAHPDGRMVLERSLYGDEALHEEEMRRVWESTWVYLAHESQLPKPGDFLAVHLGRQPVILARGKDGAVRGFINSCAHRGAMLCRQPSGNCNTFVCSFHGWSFDLEGRNIGVKDKSAGGYLPTFDETPRDLTPLPKVESYRGFIFGSLSPEVPSLVEHLAEARTFIDLLVDPAPEGLEVVRGAANYTYEGNWKLTVENALDGYHFTSVHQTFIRIAMKRPEGGGKGEQIDAVKTVTGKGGGYDLGNGHTMVWSTIPNPQVLPLYERRPELVTRYGEVRADWMLAYLRNVVIYPNLMLMYQVGSQIRVARPLGPKRTEVTTWCLAPTGESRDARAKRVLQYADFYGASGVGTPDDLAEFEACQAGYAGRLSRTMSLERGAVRVTEGPDEEARALGIRPRASFGHLADETIFHPQHREWLHLMTRGQRHV